MLEIENLKVSIEEKLIINNLSLSIKPGEIHAIMGPNGSGKSTIAHALAGKMGYEVSAGSIMLNNKNLLIKKAFYQLTLVIKIKVLTKDPTIVVVEVRIFNQSVGGSGFFLGTKIFDPASGSL